MAKKFIALRVIGLVFKVLGVITVLGAVVAAVVGVVAILSGGLRSDMMESMGLGQGIGLLTAGYVFLAGLVSGLFLFGMGEVLDLLMAMEENTRATRLLLAERLEKPAQG